METEEAETLPTCLSDQINRLVKFQRPSVSDFDLEHFKVSGGLVFFAHPLYTFFSPHNNPLSKSVPKSDTKKLNQNTHTSRSPKVCKVTHKIYNHRKKKIHPSKSVQKLPNQYKKDQKGFKSHQTYQILPFFVCIGAIVRTHRESQCILYAGFFL